MDRPGPGAGEAADETGRSEEAIVAALRTGDHDTFRGVVVELTPGLTRMARIYVSDALADEVVQETWMAVVTSIASFEGRSKLKTWIYRIMLNKVRTLATREAKVVPMTSVGPSNDNAGPSIDLERLTHPELGAGYWPAAPPRWDQLPAERLESVETGKRLGAAMADLPAAQREVVLLRDVEGWSADEVCNALGISSVNQRVLLHRGRVALRAALEEYLDDR